jgi:hypothetical protein
MPHDAQLAREHVSRVRREENSFLVNSSAWLREDQPASKRLAPPSPPSSSSSEEEDDGGSSKQKTSPSSTEKQLLQDIEQNGGREKDSHYFTKNIINLRPTICGDKDSALRKAIRNKFAYLGRLDHRACLAQSSNYQIPPSRVSLQAVALNEQPALQEATPPSATLKPLKRKQPPLLSPPRSQPVMFSPTKLTPSRKAPSKASMSLMTKSTPSRVLFGE